MGAMADYYIDAIIEDQIDRDPEPRDVVCKFCGATDVFWQHHRGRWILKNYSDGMTHNCRKVAAADEFDVL